MVYCFRDDVWMTSGCFRAIVRGPTVRDAQGSSAEVRAEHYHRCETDYIIMQHREASLTNSRLPGCPPGIGQRAGQGFLQDIQIRECLIANNARKLPERDAASRTCCSAHSSKDIFHSALSQAGRALPVPRPMNTFCPTQSIKYLPFPRFVLLQWLNYLQCVIRQSVSLYYLIHVHNTAPSKSD